MTLWRILEKLGGTLEEVQTVLDQFDERSVSSLEEISIFVKGPKAADLGQLIRCLQRSSGTLTVLHMRMLDAKMPKIESLQPLYSSSQTCKPSDY